MGIRYYGFALAAKDVWAARADPHTYVHAAEAESLRRGWSDACVDKAWSYLQHLFGGRRWTLEDDPPPRPAYRLVAGNVQETGQGYLPYYGVLTPAEMREIAPDIASVTEADVRRHCAESVALSHADVRWIAHALDQATTFSHDVVRRGQGAIYAIA